ncbi:MAG: response regulator transcription factor [Chloroflexi bacterium]|nr:response regulator transcription factor [Chloroflexota bacterium]MBM4453675.1 response regulator transcription factor [Chloroflexota bacterium]
MTTILVVDDEPNILELAKLYLEKEGHRVDGVGCGKDALARITISKPSLIVLDLMLPDIDGFDVCREIRKKSDVPILMLTARKEDVDKIIGLELGADDYLTKPFNPRELVARVKAILRRYQSGHKPGEVIEIGNLHIDPARREATIEGKPVKLRTKEFDLLKALAQNFGIVLTREQLLGIVWETDYYGETRTVDIHINHLRDKLEGSNVSIETLRGVGYKLTSLTITE